MPMIGLVFGEFCSRQCWRWLAMPGMDAMDAMGTVIVDCYYMNGARNTWQWLATWQWLMVVMVANGTTVVIVVNY